MFVSVGNLPMATFDHNKSGAVALALAILRLQNRVYSRNSTRCQKLTMSSDPVPPAPGAPTTTPTSDAGTTNVEAGNPVRLTLESSKRAYAWLAAQSENPRGIISDDGVRHHPVPVKCFDSCPELNYDKPEGFVIISRSFLPKAKKDMRVAAVRALPSQASPAQIDDMHDLMKEVWKAFIENLNGKLFVRLTQRCRDLKIKKGTKFATTIKEAGVAFRTEEPTLTEMAKYFDLFYLEIDRNNMKNEIVNESMKDLKFWFSNDEADMNYVANGKVKSSCIQHLLMEKLRDQRNPYKKGARIPHGIKFTVTVEGGRSSNGMRRRKKGDAFDPITNLSGWGEQLHVEFNSNHGYAMPEKVCSFGLSCELSRIASNCFSPQA